MTGKLVPLLSENILLEANYEDLDPWTTSGSFTIVNNTIVATGPALLTQNVVVDKGSFEDPIQTLLVRGFITPNGSLSVLGSISATVIQSNGATNTISGVAGSVDNGLKIPIEFRVPITDVEGNTPETVIVRIEAFGACVIDPLEVFYDYGERVEIAGDTIPPNLLRNSSFEIAEGNTLRSWSGTGNQYTIAPTSVLKPATPTTGTKALELFQGEFALTDPANFIAHEGKPLLVSFYASRGIGKLDIVAPSGTVLKSLDYPFGTAGRWRRYHLLITPAEMGIVSQVGIRFTTTDPFGCLIDGVKVEQALTPTGETRQTPTTWIPHPDDEAYLLGWLSTLRVDYYNWLVAHDLPTENPLTLYSVKQLVRDTKAEAPYIFPDKYNQLIYTLAEGRTDYNVFYYRYDPFNDDVTGPFAPSTFDDAYPNQQGEGIVLVISPEPRDTFNPIQHVHQAYTLRFGETEDTGTPNYLNSFEVGLTDYTYIYNPQVKDSVLRYLNGATTSIQTSDVVTLTAPVSGFSASLGFDYSGLTLSAFITTGNTTVLTSYADANRTLTVPVAEDVPTTIGIIVSEGPPTTSSVLYATAVKFELREDQTVGSEGFRMEFGSSQLAATMTFEFDYDPGYFSVPSITLGVMNLTSLTPLDVTLVAQPQVTDGRYHRVVVAATWPVGASISGYYVSMQAIGSTIGGGSNA